MKPMVAVAQKTNVAARKRGRKCVEPKTLTRVFRTHQSENRLIKSESLASVPDAAKVKVENLYDYLDRRVRKTVSSGYSGGVYTTTNVTTYIWDGMNVIAEMSDAGYTNWYTYGLDVSGTLQAAGGVGGALAMTRDTGSATNTYRYCFDGNGNVVNLVDASDGSIAATYEYSPFGQLIRSTGTMADDNPVRWSTKHIDDETGLVMYEFRPHSPELGRFIQRDPIEEEGGLNLFAFVQNEPISWVDSDGSVRLRIPRDPGILPWPRPRLPRPRLPRLPRPRAAFCRWLSGQIRRFCPSSQDRRAWDRFVSRSGSDINLTEGERCAAFSPVHKTTWTS